MRFICTDIKWDTDGKKVKLPKSMVVDIPWLNSNDSPETIEFSVGNALSDETGWCHLDFKFKEEVA